MNSGCKVDASQKLVQWPGRCRNRAEDGLSVRSHFSRTTGRGEDFWDILDIYSDCTEHVDDSEREGQRSWDAQYRNVDE